ICADNTESDGLGFGASKHPDAPRPVARVRLVNRKPIVPREDEVRNNPRARSAKLRVVERVDVD
ncbi:MAG: 16S rRNA (cytosine(1402)-N(4))-methyltransferase, partial [Candidatus Roseilinea sp.]|uniref:16S rRNA (cytosine(1402)-N(4))-methyltransferase n=1 Tax=Candidatus Roseilinea sp. TaxID=2838777 RepID=UPI00404B7A79